MFMHFIKSHYFTSKNGCVVT